MRAKLAHMTNTYTSKSWEEQIVAGEDGAPRFAHAHASFEYHGTLEGTSTCDMLLYYAGEGYDGGQTTSPGYEFFEGTLDGRAGSFITRHEFGYDASGIRDTFTVVPGSGTGELAGLTGSGTAASGMHADAVDYTIEYSL
jgi:hypothetical protein